MRSSTSTPSEKTTVGAIGHVNQITKNNLKLALAEFAGVILFSYIKIYVNSGVYFSTFSRTVLMTIQR